MRTPMGFTSPQPPTKPAWSYSTWTKFFSNLSYPLASLTSVTKTALTKRFVCWTKHSTTGQRSHTPHASLSSLHVGILSSFSILLVHTAVDRRPFRRRRWRRWRSSERRRLTHWVWGPTIRARRSASRRRLRSVAEHGAPRCMRCTCLFLFSTFLKYFFNLKVYIFVLNGLLSIYSLVNNT